MTISDEKLIPSASNVLAEFETESGSLLDEMGIDPAGMLDEFEGSIEIILSDEPLTGEEFEIIPDAENQNEATSENISGEDQITSEILEQPATEPAHYATPLPVVGFVCEHSVDLSDLRSHDSDPVNILTVPLPCAGMIKPEWVNDCLGKRAAGVFVVSCTPDSCAHRSGSCITQERWTGNRSPVLNEEVDSDRVRLFQFHPTEKSECLNELRKFVLSLPPVESIQQEPDPPESIDLI